MGKRRHLVLIGAIIAMFSAALLALVGCGDPVQSAVSAAREYAREGKLDDAIREYEAAFTAWGQQPERDYKEAGFTRADIEKEFAQVLYTRANAAWEQGKFDEAVALTEKGLQFAPENEQLRKFKNELTDWKKEADRFLNEAEALIAKGNFYEAVFKITGAETTAPGYGRIEEFRQQYLQALQEKIGPLDYITARIAVKDAIKMIPFINADTVRYLAISNPKLGKRDGQLYWVIDVQYRAKSIFGNYVEGVKRGWFRNGALVALTDATRSDKVVPLS